MKTKKQIIEWLKSNGLYDAFAKNISSENVENQVEQFVAEEKSRNILASSFLWQSTNEGYDFWHNADKEFLRWLNSDEHTELSSDRWIFDRGSKEAPFYMVYAEGESSPTYKHGLMEEATKEANRLAKSLNTKTYVLAAVMEIRPEIVTYAVGIDDMEHEEDCPF